MAATVQIRRFTGAGPTATDITGINTVGQTTDAHQVPFGTSQPIQIPTALFKYGFWVTTGLEVTAAPATGINNVRWFTDGLNNFAAGVDALVGDTNPLRATGYVQAGLLGGDIVGDTGVELTNANYAGITATSVAFTYTSGSPITVSNGSIGAVTGPLGDYVIYQIRVAPAASPGHTLQETWTWAFDET